MKSSLCPDFESSHLAVALAEDRLGFSYFSLDALGRGSLERNPMLNIPDTPPRYRLEKSGNGVFHYYPLFKTDSIKPFWTVTCADNRIILRNEYQSIPACRPGYNNNLTVHDFRLTFLRNVSAAALLGIMEEEHLVSLPCVLHLPDMGSVRIRCSVAGRALGYEVEKTRLPSPLVPYTYVSFPRATKEHPVVEYELEVAAIYPQVTGIEEDERFDVFRRNYLNMFQMGAKSKVLGAVDATGSAVFNCHMSTEAIAAHKVQLVDDLYVSDLLRVTVDAVLYDENQKKVARAGGDLKYDFLDLDPSYIISCALYAQSTGDWDWARTRYSEVMKLVRQMMDKDRDGCGLIEFEESGNYNSDRVIKGTHATFNPANWWDAINFGHQDAYANALAYEALKRWGAVAETIGNQEDALWMKQKSEKLKKAFHEKLFNPATGIFAGWRSADGELHDYWFLFLNSIVIVYDMVDGQLAEDIMDRFLDKLHKVGFTNYRLGLPGNLSPIRKGDVRPIGGDRSVQRMCGRPALEDGSDAFQYYENGGASTRYMYYTLKALYKLKRFDEARRMLYPLLESYEAGEHAGIDVDGNSSDWTTWDGTACGYEGFAVGNFFPLINVLDELEARNEEAKQAGK